MSDFTQTALVAVILLFLALIVWSKVQNQRMLDTIKELKEIVKNIKED